MGDLPQILVSHLQGQARLGGIQGPALLSRPVAPSLSRLESFEVESKFTGRPPLNRWVKRPGRTAKWGPGSRPNTAPGNPTEHCKLIPLAILATASHFRSARRTLLLSLQDQRRFMARAWHINRPGPRSRSTDLHSGAFGESSFWLGKKRGKRKQVGNTGPSHHMEARKRLPGVQFNHKFPERKRVQRVPRVGKRASSQFTHKPRTRSVERANQAVAPGMDELLRLFG